MKTIIYVDGFNLYYRMLKARPGLRWLNPLRLAAEILDSSNAIIKVRYFTARVTGRLDPSAPARQQIYLDALSTIPEVDTHFGNFLLTKTWAGLVPPDLDPSRLNAKPPFLPWPTVVRIFKTEEKGSDVNIATNLLIDAYSNAFDVAVLITNDTDLCEPLRHVACTMGKVVGLLTPVAKPAHDLKKYASFVRHIRDQHLLASQLPESMELAGGRTIRRPIEWA